MRRSTMFNESVSWKLYELLKEAGHCLQTLSDGEIIERHGAAFGDLGADTEIKADRVVGEFLRDAIVGDPGLKAGRVTVEGLGDLKKPVDQRQAPWYCVDPLDGSLNYKRRNGTLGLPHTACVTALQRADGATFDDVFAAAVYDFRSGDIWRAWRETNGTASRIVTEVNADLIEPDLADETPFDLGSMIVFGESYYPDNREMLARAFAGRKGWLRSPGSAAYEMACVSNGIAAGFICGTQKQHELGAGMLLVQGAGGVVTDFDGRAIAGRPFDFTTQVPVVMGRTPRIHADLLELVRGAAR